MLWPSDEAYAPTAQSEQLVPPPAVPGGHSAQSGGLRPAGQAPTMHVVALDMALGKLPSGHALHPPAELMKPYPQTQAVPPATTVRFPAHASQAVRPVLLA